MTEQQEPLATAPWGIFPPWGVMNNDDTPVINAKPQRPPAWKENEAEHERWFAETLKLIQDLIWPVFDRSTQSWQGASVPMMEALTRADLDLLRAIYSDYPPIFEQPVDAPEGMLARKKHHDFFSEEDLFVHNWGTSYASYDAAWTSDQITNMKAIIQDANVTKVGPHLLRFKNILQRPRPYQMALILGYHDFNYYEALSADTPSICCGHCMQSMLSVGSVMEQLIRGNQDFTLERWAALEQFSVDIGDRRVMARVHYPSDNLCSWLIVLRAANHVFAAPEVKEHLWHAISKRSFVYRLISNSKHCEVYDPILAEIAAEARR